MNLKIQKKLFLTLLKKEELQDIYIKNYKKDMKKKTIGYLFFISLVNYFNSN